MWPFRARPLVEADVAARHVENFAWLIRQFGRNGAFAASRLVLPRPGFFDANGAQGHAQAERIFAQVKSHCGMTGWDVDLIEDDNPLARRYAPQGFGLSAGKRHALGSFGANGNRIEISYVPDLVREPERLIATFAHELAHHLLLTAAEWPICDDDEKECLTDLAAVFMGFGVFLANARFSVETYSDGAIHGWRIGHASYLREADLIFALALFLRAKDLDPKPACNSLKPHLARLLRRAMRTLPPQHSDVAQLRDALAAADHGMAMATL